MCHVYPSQQHSQMTLPQESYNNNQLCLIRSCRYKHFIQKGWLQNAAVYTFEIWTTWKPEKHGFFLIRQQFFSNIWIISEYDVQFFLNISKQWNVQAQRLKVKIFNEYCNLSTPPKHYKRRITRKLDRLQVIWFVSLFYAQPFWLWQCAVLKNTRS